MRTKTLANDSFILPKFLYIARHIPTTNLNLKNCQAEISHLLNILNEKGIQASKLYLTGSLQSTLIEAL